MGCGGVLRGGCWGVGVVVVAVEGKLCLVDSEDFCVSLECLSRCCIR